MGQAGQTYPVSLFFAAALGFAAPGLSQDPSQDPQQDPQEVELPEEEVRGERQGALTTPSADQAERELRQIPGGGTFIRAEQFRNGRVGDISDVLRLSPSVYVQSRFGGSETRLSVRGSGIRQTFNAIGVRILRNGIPLSEADGNVRPQLIDPLIVEYAEVLPGANGFVYGSSTLGGAINFVTPTGHTADPFKIRTAFGSDDHTHTQISTGRALDNGFDYYFTTTLLDRDGFRVSSEERLQQIYGNVGYRLNDEWEARLHVTGLESDLQLPGSLTKAQIHANARQPNPSWAAVPVVRDFDMVRGDVQLTGNFGDGARMDIAASFQWLEMFHPLPFGPGGPNLNRQDRRDYTASVRYRTPLGDSNELVAGAFVAFGDDESTRFTISSGAQNRDQDRRSITAEIFVEDRFRLTDELRVVGGLQAALSRRDFGDNINSANDVDEDYFGLQPKVGFLWDPNEDVQFFGNVSRSFEPPTDGNIQNSTGKLDEQTAWTVEVGARGELGNTAFQGAVYYAIVDDELLTVENPVGSGLFETGNTDTTHFGVELALQQRIPLGFLHGEEEGDTDALIAQGTYTYQQFEFDDVPVFGSNYLPGIPMHLFRADVTYQAPCGFYSGVNIDVSSSWHVDFTNSLRADSFAILGATAGYNADDWKMFVDVINLENKNYASNSGIATNLNGMDSATFNPGMPFSLFFGVELTL